MTHHICILIIGSLAISSCTNESHPLVKSPSNIPADTGIYSKPITMELPGGANRTRATSYSLVIAHDTSDLACYFQEYLSGGVGFEISFAENKTYASQFTELQSILQAASQEYNMDSLRGAFLYLMETGDLAIDITKQLSDSDIRQVTNNRSTANFLLKSKLTDDLNRLLLPYKKKVKQYAIEHPMLISSEYLVKNNQIDTHGDKIPSKVLDGTIWVYFK